MPWPGSRLVVAVVALASVAGCSGSSGSSGYRAPAASPPARDMKLSMSGALSGPYQVVAGKDNLCGGRLADDPQGLNYILWGHVEGAGSDVGVGINFAIHRYAKPATFAVGLYPAGSTAAPAIASVTREITPREQLSWISGSGSIVVDAGTRSGTLNLHLNSTTALAELVVSGSWVCPEGS